MTTKQAKELKIGDQVIERDGALLEVVQIAGARTLTIQLESFGPGPNPIIKLRATTRVNVV